MKLLRIFLICVLAVYSGDLSAAYLRNVPQTLTQPDGRVIHCFATGDEHYHWLHDSNGYTIVLDRSTGFFVYAQLSNGDLAPTRWLPGVDNPASVGLRPRLNISDEVYRQRYANRYREPDLKSARTFKNTGNYNNLVVFVRFSNQNEYTESLTHFSTAFNSTGTVSLKEYYKEVSKQQLTISTTFYPLPSGTTIVSYQDSHSRRYYQPYSATNPDGYQNDNQYVSREMTLLKNAALSVANQVVASGVNYDHNNDGYIDNVCYIIQGPTDGWNDLLWPHRWVLYTEDVRIGGLRVYDFNFQLSESFGVSVLCHEMFHSLGAPDLYRYENQDITPVGPWDLMAYNTNPPQHMGAYMKMKYGQWFDEIPTITADGTYSLHPLSNDGYAAYRIASPNSTTEFFVLEYRKAAGMFESGIVGSGLIIYRINETLEGNAQGPPDEVYVYRLNGTTRTDGNVNNATFASNLGRTDFGDNTNPSDFLSNGNPGGISISNIGAIGETISFTVGSGGGFNPPQNLDASLNGTTVNLTWNRPDPGGATLTGYRIYRNAAQVATINNPNTLTYSQTGLAAGTWQYYVTAVYTTPAGESPPSNTVTVTVGTQALPDLVVEQAVVDPLNMEPGTDVALFCRVKNQGNGVAGPSMLRIYLSQDAAFDSGDRQLAYKSLGGLDPNAFGEVDLAGSIPLTINTGNWYILFQADADAAVTESIEDNNLVSVPIVIGNPELKPPRNLVAQVAGQSVILGWNPPETGGGTPGGYYVYRNGNRIFEIADPNTLEYTDAGLANGVYTYFVTAYYTQPVGESPGSNEVSVTITTVEKPDLTPQNLVVSPEEVSPGGSVDISCSILNIGTGTAGACEVRLYLSQDLIIDQNDIYLAYGTIDALDAGSRINVTGSYIKLPGDLASGPWNAILLVDATQVVDESNEENNMISVQLMVQGQTPDLQITNMVLFPAIITPRSNVRITLNVMNDGPVMATPVDVDFFLSADEYLDASDVLICHSATRLLSAESNILMYSGFVMPSIYTPGQYFLIGYIDPDKLVNESDESNNLYIMPVTLAATTGTGQIVTAGHLKIYPVPAKGKVTLEFMAETGRWGDLSVIDLSGRELYRCTFVSDGLNRLTLDTDGWPAGQLILRVRDEDQQRSLQFMKE